MDNEPYFIHKDDIYTTISMPPFPNHKWFWKNIETICMISNARSVSFFLGRTVKPESLRPPLILSMSGNDFLSFHWISEWTKFIESKTDSTPIAELLDLIVTFEEFYLFVACKCGVEVTIFFPQKNTVDY